MLNDIRLHFGQAKALYRLLFVNSVVYLLFGLSGTLLYLFNGESHWLNAIINRLSMPADPGLLMYQPWSILTYMFLHVELLHVLFNMLVLSWTGRLFTEYLGNDKLWATYLLGGISGGMLYFIGYNFLPVFSSVSQHAYLLGASAGVVAILVAIATLLPDYTIQLLLIGSVRLKYLALFLVFMYILAMRDGNAGGQLAHLGGALFGFLFIKQLQAGRDLTKWLVNLSKKAPFLKRKSHLKVVSRSAMSSDDLHREKLVATQENIDRILDKINKSGFDSLTKEEKDILYQASGKK